MSEDIGTQLFETMSQIRDTAGALSAAARLTSAWAAERKAWLVAHPTISATEAVTLAGDDEILLAMRVRLAELSGSSRDLADGLALVDPLVPEHAGVLQALAEMAHALGEAIQAEVEVTQAYHETVRRVQVGCE